MCTGGRFKGSTLSFHDVVLEPETGSSYLPLTIEGSDLPVVSLRTRLTRRVVGNIPLLSAAMDTVTESEMAKAVARSGGVGVIHRNLTIEQQAREIDKVKRAQSGMIRNPLTVTPDMTLDDVENLAREYRYSGFPVVDEHDVFVGLVTNRDIRLQPGHLRVSQVMTPLSRVQTLGLGTSWDQAKDFFRRTKFEKLPLVTTDGRVVGMYTFNDAKNEAYYPDACLDDSERLVVAAAVGTFGADLHDRAQACVAAGANILVIDAKNGHHQTALEALSILRKCYPDVDIIPPNVVTGEGALAQIERGADAIKVGMGIGSICTSTDVTGVGMPQFTATLECARVAQQHNIPVITDGGLTSSADIVKSLVAGASAIMTGRLLAGTDETPALAHTDDPSIQLYRGMGSSGAMSGRSATRYMQNRLPEGVEAAVANRGSVYRVISDLMLGVRTGMSELNAGIIEDLWKVRYWEYTVSGQIESHPHDVVILEKKSREGLR